MKTREPKNSEMLSNNESGKVGYFVAWLLGAPVGLLIVLWLILGDNIFGAG